jgi:hypothetical protein
MNEFPATPEGETITPLEYELELRAGTLEAWVSGTIQIFDATPGVGVGAVLSGFSTPVAVTVGGTGNSRGLWYPAWGSGSGLLPAITRDAKYLVRFVMTNAAGRVKKSPLIPWVVCDA